MQSSENPARSPRLTATRTHAAILASAAFAALSLCSMTSAAPIVNGGVPDFYQHQYLFRNPGGINGWEKTAQNGADNVGVGGGWCRPTSLVDSLYSLRARGYTNLLASFNNAALTWQDASRNEIINMRNAQPGIQPIKNYVASVGYGQFNGPRGNGLSVNQYSVDNSGNTYYLSAYGRYVPLKQAGVARKAFDVYTDAIARGDAINLKFGPGTNTSPNRWWGNYHYVSGVGVDAATNTIYFADPDSNKGSTDADAGWNFTMLDAGVAGRRYGAADALPVGPANPAGAGFSNFYGSAVIKNGFQVDPAAGAGNPNRYKGITITGFETITPIRAGKVVRPALSSPGASVIPPTVVSDVDLDTQEGDLVDKILILPVNTDVSGTFDDTFSDDDSWTDTELPDNFVDPLGEIRQFGGIEYDVAANPDADPDGLEAGEISTATIGTMTDFTAYDVLMHDALTDSWLVDAIGGPEENFEDQTGVPEPTALLLGLVGPLLLTRQRRRR